jgi:hypothetical protein
VRQRLRENAEVVGTDERFFDDDRNDRSLVDLYHEKADLLEGEEDGEVDLASQAYQIWKNAVDADPAVEQAVTRLPDVVYATRAMAAEAAGPPGVLLYLRTAEGTDALTWIDAAGAAVTQSQLAILHAAACGPDTPALPRRADHHELVRRGVGQVIEQERTTGGQLGRPSGARFRAYERLKRLALEIRGTLFDLPDLARAIDEIYRFPLRPAAADVLNRQLRAGISDPDFAQLVLTLREEGRLCQVRDEPRDLEPRILCSLGLAPAASEE